MFDYGFLSLNVNMVCSGDMVILKADCLRRKRIASAGFVIQVQMEGIHFLRNKICLIMAETPLLINGVL